MTNQTIHILNDTTINQIAAGEVVENPSSVIKELIENSLDAKASEIKIETTGGGHGNIRISDDGCGILPDDLVLALQRHATSKLSDINDLDTLRSLGFRGEALSSISSVSKIYIHSATASDNGNIIYAEGGHVLYKELKPRQRGTTVEVKSLFFNVPVRKKFQKSPSRDNVEIHKTLTNISLCHNGVSFSWIADGEERLKIASYFSLGERVQNLLGDDFEKSIFPIEAQNEKFKMSGFCSKATFHRPNKTGQYLFINNRPIVSSFISQKISEGYGVRLPTHRYPLFVLHLVLPGSLVDINVHPQKKHVRLREEEELGLFISKAIENGFYKTQICVPPIMNKPIPLYQEKIIPLPPKESTTTHSYVQEVKEFVFNRRPLSKVGKYVLVEDLEGVRVVDCAAAYVRIIYEQMKNDQVAPTESQGLLIPMQVEFSAPEMDNLINGIHVLERIGFSLRPFGKTTFIVDGIPPMLDKRDVVTFLQNFLESEHIPLEQKVCKILKQAFKLASMEQGEILVKQLFKCKEPNYTPDGKPIHYLLTESRLSP